MNFENRTLFHGDNLEFLQGMNSESVDLIAPDPPFNKSADFHATPDSLAGGASFTDRWRWEDDAHPEYVDAIKDAEPRLWWVIEAARRASGDDMGAFLCWLGVRVIEMERILKPTGSLYLHIDDTAQAYVKAMLDAVFGRGNFRNAVVWKRTSSRSDAKRFGRVYDTILYYVKGDNPTWNTQYSPHNPEYVEKFYRFDDDGRGPWQSSGLTAPGHNGGNTEIFQPWRGIDPWQRTGRCWNVPMKGGMADYIVSNNLIPGWLNIPSVHARLDALDTAGLVAWPKKQDSMPRLKLYLAASRGNAACDVITDIPPLSGHSLEKTGYPTQKPLALYERIIASSSNPGDLVLDPFAGCATTCVAAERLGRQWVGMDIWKGSHALIKQRMADNRQLLADPDAPIRYTTTPPVRTDEADEAVTPTLVLKAQRVKAKWERLSHTQMRGILGRAQAHAGQVACAGCGIALPIRFMELDHQLPRKDGGMNYILNRILLCGPCNGAKAANLTLSGLIDRNKKAGEPTDESVARKVTGAARDAAEQCQIDMGGGQ